VLLTGYALKGENPMAKEKITMVEATLAPEKKGADSTTIQLRSSDVDRMKKVYGDRLTVKGKVSAESEPEAKKAPAAKNKARTA
jgi:hypothetical protein